MTERAKGIATGGRDAGGRQHREKRAADGSAGWAMDWKAVCMAVPATVRRPAEHAVDLADGCAVGSDLRSRRAKAAP